MIRIGIVGTNWISASLIEGCGDVNGVEVVAICSRKVETGEKFAAEHGLKRVYTSYLEMVSSDEIDAVYIASPNSLHFHYSKVAMEHGKHVLCEKPFTSNRQELEVLIAISKKEKVVLMEAIKTLALPSYSAIEEGLEKIGKIRQVVFQKYQYSSRYEAVKAGEVPNVFNPAFSGGALTDIGVYAVYPTLHLFGEPKEIKTIGHVLETGADGCGTSLWTYDDFDVTIAYSKITNSTLPSLIMGEEGTIEIDSISAPERIVLKSLNGKEEILYEKLQHHPMSYEVKEFIETIKAGEIESARYNHEIALTVMKTLDTMREQLGVVYPSDK